MDALKMMGYGLIALAFLIPYLLRHEQETQ